MKRNENQNIENQKYEQDLLPIVGIGASAGGLNALKNFFKNIPADSGVAYVVVVHLSPEHKSMMAELLQPHVDIPVLQVNDNMLLEPNHIYVIPPNANLNTIDTHLRLTKLEEKISQRAPVDHFFRTLAHTHGSKAVGVILTGTGSDGTLGIKDIKEKGGLTIVQDPVEAEYDGMPKSALSTGMVDKTLTIDKIPSYLVEFLSTSPRIRTLETGESDDTEGKLIKKIIGIIKTRVNRDFSQYKTTTLLRRLQRRMQMYRVENIEEYVDILQNEPNEPLNLSDDFLINVTHFFRDQKVFEYLEKEIIPSLIKNKKPDDHIRVWSVGCATGEEAYSIAILLWEAVSKMEAAPTIQIFATDLHEESLQKGREAFYPGDIKTNVSEERLKKYFVKEDGGYRIREEIRDLVIFAPHNLLNDPPFSRLDLLVCRNLLIYLKRKIQNDILELFHYALLPTGFLFLGTSERCDNTDLFEPENNDQAFFKKRDVVSPEPKLPVFPTVNADLKSLDTFGKPGSQETLGHVHGKIIEHYGPPSLLMNIDYQVLHLSDSSGRYLRLDGGEITKDIFRLINKELHGELRAIILSAKNKPVIARSRPTRIKIDGNDCYLVLATRAINYPGQPPLFLVMFEEYEVPVENVQDEKVSDNADNKRIQGLENELAETRERLQSTIEVYETSREEMKASHEEMQSSNEELRSTMEELETSKEELQSMNEELTTMNQENRNKVQELNHMSDDLQNFLAATRIASLFLDKNMRILRFTPKLEELFNIRSVDKGRPISDQTHTLIYDKLMKDGQQVLKTLQSIEKEVKDEKGRTFLTRILPYRSSTDEIKGVVITFIDITPRKEMENRLVKEEARFRNLLKASSNIIYRVNHDWSQMLELKGHGFIPDTTKPDKNWLGKYVHPDDRKKVKESIKKAVNDRVNFSIEHKVIQTNGSTGWVFSRAIPIFDSDGNISEWFGAASNITSRKEIENELFLAKDYAEKIIETLHEPLIVLEPDLTVKSVNDAFYEFFQVDPDTTIGHKIYNLGNGQWSIPSLKKLLEDVLPNNKFFNNFRVEHEFNDIGEKTLLLNARRLDHVQLILLGIRDVTSQVIEDKRLRQSEEHLKNMIDVKGVGIVTFNHTGKWLEANNAFLEMVGHTREELESGKLNWFLITPGEKHELLRSYFKELGEKGNIGPGEKEYICPGGARSWMMFAGAAIGEDKYVDYCFDISDKKQAEKALEESQQRMKITLQSIEMGSWEIGEGEETGTFDEGCLRLFGFPPNRKKVSLNNFYRNIHPDDKEKVDTDVKKAWEGSGNLDTEFRMFLNGDEKWFAGRGKIIQDDGTRKMIGVNYEITKTKRYEKALQEAKTEAEKAARAKEEFLAHMSHEIRTPLNAVIGISHLLHEKKSNNNWDKQLDNLRTLRVAADNLGTLINDILDYSKIQAGKTSLDEEPFNLEELVKNIIVIHEIAADEKGIKLEYHVDENIGDEIVTDRLKLSHVLNNLLSNAVKFTLNGEVKLTVERVNEKKDKQSIHFSVHDTGIGIPENKREKIFDVFSQGDNSTVRQFGGSGLGLTIVKLYLQMMNSDIQLESEPGVGSNFYFKLDVSTIAKEITGKKKQGRYESGVSLKDLKVLLVEDDEFNQMMIIQFLELWEVEYDTANNGVEAVEMAMGKRYDIILMDIRMPEMDGYMATKEIRKIKNYKDGCIIALTADISERVKNELAAGTFTDVSIKPINPDELKKKIWEGIIK